MQQEKNIKSLFKAASLKKIVHNFLLAKKSPLDQQWSEDTIRALTDVREKMPFYVEQSFQELDKKNITHLIDSVKNCLEEYKRISYDEFEQLCALYSYKNISSLPDVAIQEAHKYYLLDLLNRNTDGSVNKNQKEDAQLIKKIISQLSYDSIVLINEQARDRINGLLTNVIGEKTLIAIHFLYILWPQEVQELLTEYKNKPEYLIIFSKLIFSNNNIALLWKNSCLTRSQLIKDCVQESLKDESDRTPFIYALLEELKPAHRNYKKLLIEGLRLIAPLNMGPYFLAKFLSSSSKTIANEAENLLIAAWDNHKIDDIIVDDCINMLNKHKPQKYTKEVIAYYFERFKDKPIESISALLSFDNQTIKLIGLELLLFNYLKMDFEIIEFDIKVKDYVFELCADPEMDVKKRVELIQNRDFIQLFSLEEKALLNKELIFDMLIDEAIPLEDTIDFCSSYFSEIKFSKEHLAADRKFFSKLPKSLGKDFILGLLIAIDSDKSIEKRLDGLVRMMNCPSEWSAIVKIIDMQFSTPQAGQNNVFNECVAVATSCIFFYKPLENKNPLAEIIDKYSTSTHLVLDSAYYQEYKNFLLLMLMSYSQYITEPGVEFLKEKLLEVQILLEEINK